MYACVCVCCACICICGPSEYLPFPFPLESISYVRSRHSISFPQNVGVNAAQKLQTNDPIKISLKFYLNKSLPSIGYTLGMVGSGCGENLRARQANEGDCSWMKKWIDAKGNQIERKTHNSTNANMLSSGMIEKEGRDREGGGDGQRKSERKNFFTLCVSVLLWFAFSNTRRKLVY